MKKITVALIFVFFLCGQVYGKNKRLEKDYQNDWCAENNGVAEVRLSDGTRADCVTKTHAIEFYFGKKWAESIGQALYYSMQTEKKAGIVLILESIEDRKYWIRLNSIIENQNLKIDTWKIENF